MDIYILRDGSEIGPFDEATTQEMLQLGSIREVDYAWRPGLPKWIPLTDVLKPSPLALETPPPPPPEAEEPLSSGAAVPAESAHLPKAGESATPKQKALLRYLLIGVPADITKDQAALRINDAMEDPQNATRLAQWNSDRLKLHPDLFAAEIQAKKEGRVNEYLEICQGEGAQYFTKITKAHCQVLVGYLDVKFPDWDKDEKTAAERYFFPAVAEKFPQLVARQWKGKLRYASGTRDASGQRPASRKLPPIPTPKSPMAAMVMGLVGGVVVLGIIFGIYKMVSGHTAKHVPPVKEIPAHPTAPVAPELPNGEGKISDIPPIPNLPTVPTAPPEGGMVDATNPAPVAPAPADPGMAGPLPSSLPEGFPPDPLASAPTGQPPMAGSAPAPAPAPVGSLPPDAPPSGGSLFDPAPTAPAPAAPAVSAPPTAPATPAVSPAPPVVAVDPSAPPKTNLKLTKPVDMQLAYGKMKLPVGTAVKLVSRKGNQVEINYLNTILVVPAASTDIDVPAATAPAPVAPAPVAPPPPPVAPAPPADPAAPGF